MRLAPKLIAPQVVVLVLIVAAAIVQASLSNQERRTLERATAELQKVAGQIQRLNQLFSDSERDVLSYYAQPGLRHELRLREAQQEAAALLEAVSQAPWPPRGAALTRELRSAYDTMSEAQLEFLEQRETEKAREAFVRWWFVAQQANAMLADLSTYNMRRLDQALAEISTARTSLGDAILALTATASLLAVLYAFWVLQQVLRPIALLTEASGRVGEQGQTVPRFDDRKDEIGHLASTLADMTGRLTRSRDELEDALSARDQFLSIAAHELKTPLTSLTLQLQLIKRKLTGTSPDDAAHHSMASLERQVGRIGDLVEELLDVSRLQAGRLELDLERVRLAPDIEEVAARCEELLTRAGCALSLSLDADVVGDIDRSRFDQVMVNLLGNAAKYAPGAPVRVTLTREAGTAIIRVSDGGPGIPEELRPRLFQRFGRPAGARAAGLGLGLFISQQIVAAHGGSIAVESEHGRGTEFVVRLPCASAAS